MALVRGPMGWMAQVPVGIGCGLAIGGVAWWLVSRPFMRSVLDRYAERIGPLLGNRVDQVMVSLWFENALQAFQILLQIGAGTGLVFLLRWFWWRINAWSELSAMVVSFAVAVYFGGRISLEPIGIPLGVSWAVPDLHPSLQLAVGVAVTTVGWIVVTFLTRPAAPETLRRFHDAIQPMGPGWAGAGLGLVRDEDGDSPAAAFLAWFLGVTVVYGALFGIGYTLYGRTPLALLCLGTSAVAGVFLMRTLPRVGLR